MPFSTNETKIVSLKEMPVVYRDITQRDREEIEILLRSPDQRDITDALLSATYYEPDWKWVQVRCLDLSHHPDHIVRWYAAICLGHIARIHGQLDLDLVLQRLTEMKSDPLVRSGAEDALDDIRIFLNFQ